MIKVFIDANVLFSAARSRAGGSAYIFKLAEKGRLKLFSARLALKEAERNLVEKKDEETLLMLYDLLERISVQLVDADKAIAKKKYAGVFGAKDAPIFASAVASKAEFLITLDKKHFLHPKIAKENLPIKIVSPGQFIEKYL